MPGGTSREVRTARVCNLYRLVQSCCRAVNDFLYRPVIYFEGHTIMLVSTTLPSASALAPALACTASP